MASLTSAERLSQAKTVVLKIGSALLVDPETREPRLQWLEGLARDVAELRRQGRNVVIVSSGSISLGRSVLRLPEGPLALEKSQAAAAVGQIKLARAYEMVLAPFGIVTAQVLVTLEDSEARRRYLNSRRTLETLLELGTVPIVNENDTVATDEIRYGDNDRLAAQVASMAGADILVLLSDVDGFYSANPKADPTAKRYETIEEITPEIEAMAGGPGSNYSSGGMATKVMAARIATRAGCSMAICEGAVERPVSALLNGAACTWFEAVGDPHVARKRWITGMKPRGRIMVDSGAVSALASGKSLLSAGVTEVIGSFSRGDPIDIVDGTGTVIARALAGYGAVDARKIMGHRSSRIPELLGFQGRAEVIHRNDMVMQLGVRT